MMTPQAPLPASAALAPKSRPSFLAMAGTVLGSIIKHVPTRGVLWAVLGFVLGLICIAASLVLGVLVLDRGALLLGYALAIPGVLLLAGTALFAMHGVHRGAARAALELERKFGLVRYVVDRVFTLLAPRVGGFVTNLPLAKAEVALKEVLDEYIGSDDMLEGQGLSAWIVRRGKRQIVSKIDVYVLAAYRAEERPDGSGGGVSLEKVAARASAEMSSRLGDLVMSPLNKQLALFTLLVVILDVGWWWILLQILSLLGKL
jgi:hypothetical protein